MILGQVVVSWQPNPAVWVLILGAVSVGFFASRVLQPNAVAAGLPAITRRQKGFYAAGVLGMWVSSDWPIHEIAEQYLYFVHMFQHLALSIVVPALFVLATPRWLLELLIPPAGKVWGWLARGSRPVAAAVLFNLATLLLHLTVIVQLSADSGAAHFLLHQMVFLAGALMWMPVIGPVSEWRLQPLGKCVYLFTMSIVPTVPGGWLVFSTGVVYPAYDRAERLWGIDVLTDQQAAGVVMKLVAGFGLWAVITVIFFRYVSAESRKDTAARRARNEARLSAPNLDPDLDLNTAADGFAKAASPGETHH